MTARFREPRGVKRVDESRAEWRRRTKPRPKNVLPSVYIPRSVRCEGPITAKWVKGW